MSGSIGLIDNYNGPDSYSEHFVDVNAGYGVVLDHCWDPRQPWDVSTKATSIGISLPPGPTGGVGYDYYFGPYDLFE